jgi:hypothetical protein
MPALSEASTAPDTACHEKAFAVNSFSCRSDSFFIFRRDDAPSSWTPPASYIVYTPPEPDRGACYGASLAADDLLEEFRAALIGGDDLAARMAFHTLRGLAEVVIEKLRGERLQ